jgi:two-component system, cell cycle response regulator
MTSETTAPRVLIVDDSRIVRATLGKMLRAHFDIREEADGEAGWEALVVDPSIRVVLTDLSMPRLDGYGLLRQIRDSKVARIRDVPVIMISGDEDEEARQRATEVGATDFIAKGIGSVELLARIGTVLGLARARDEALTDGATGLLSPLALRRQGEQAFSFSQRHGAPLSLLVVGFDNAAVMAAGDGRRVVESLIAQFARMLAGVVRKEDSVARWSDSDLAILSPGTSGQQAAAFAERIRQAVGNASIRYHGEMLAVTVSVGIAAFPEDALVDLDALVGTAVERLALAHAQGGNCIVAGSVAVGDAGRRSKLARLGLSLLPLLQRLDKEFRLGLPLVEIERRLTVAQGNAE